MAFFQVWNTSFKRKVSALDKKGNRDNLGIISHISP